jgi:hypothetical protein
MFRATGLLCACLVAVGGGCALNVGNTRVDVAVKVDEQAINASIDTAAARLKAELERRGLQVAISQDGDAIKVISRTKGGDQFTLVLTRQEVAGKELTKVRVEWATKPDRELWLALVFAAGATALEAAR